jgi:hypothetical protein
MCGLAFDLLDQSTRKFQKQWSALTAEDANFLLADLIVVEATQFEQIEAENAPARRDRLVAMLIDRVVDLAFWRFYNTPHVDAWVEAIVAAKSAVNEVLSARLRDFAGAAH